LAELNPFIYDQVFLQVIGFKSEIVLSNLLCCIQSLLSFLFLGALFLGVLFLGALFGGILVFLTLFLGFLALGVTSGGVDLLAGLLDLDGALGNGGLPLGNLLLLGLVGLEVPELEHDSLKRAVDGDGGADVHGLIADYVGSELLHDCRGSGGSRGGGAGRLRVALVISKEAEHADGKTGKTTDNAKNDPKEEVELDSDAESGEQGGQSQNATDSN